MKLGIFLGLLGISQAAQACRKDSECSGNWFKKSCCSDFECNAWCNVIRCRQDSCAKLKCAKPAEQFYDYVHRDGRTVCQYQTNPSGVSKTPTQSDPAGCGEQKKKLSDGSCIFEACPPYYKEVFASGKLSCV